MAASAHADPKVLRRRELKHAIGGLDDATRADASAEIRRRLAPELPTVGLVASFAALPGEPDLLADENHFIRPTSPQRHWCFPRVEEKDGLHLYRINDLSDFEIGAFGIREPLPDADQKILPERIDLFLVPGLGFDPTNGQRLGRGKGFYDRLLSQAKAEARFIGVGFECQLGEVPFEAHDIPLHAIVTEDRFLTLR